MHSLDTVHSAISPLDPVSVLMVKWGAVMCLQPSQPWSSLFDNSSYGSGGIELTIVSGLTVVELGPKGVLCSCAVVRCNGASFADGMRPQRSAVYIGGIAIRMPVF